MGKHLDLTGKQFQSLTVLGLSHQSENRCRYWHCLCRCGNKTITRGTDLVRNKVKTCGHCPSDIFIDDYEGVAYIIINKRNGSQLSAKIDIQDVDLVKNYRWFVNDMNYVYCPKVGRLHRLIMNPGAGKEIDHINHDTLDNRRSNLRICYRYENGRNKRARSSTGFKNVYFHGKGFIVEFSHFGKYVCRKSFELLEDAVKFRNKMLKDFHQEFACYE